MGRGVNAVAWYLASADLSTGTEIPRNPDVRYCKECTKSGRNVRLSSYNKGTACLRHPLPEKDRSGFFAATC